MNRVLLRFRDIERSITARTRISCTQESGPSHNVPDLEIGIQYMTVEIPGHRDVRIHRYRDARDTVIRTVSFHL
jgi:hypothetical protein